MSDINLNWLDLSIAATFQKNNDVTHKQEAETSLLFTTRLKLFLL